MKKGVAFLFLFMAVTCVFSQRVVLTLDAPDECVRGIEWVDGTLWVLDTLSDSVYGLDPATGDITKSFYIEHKNFPSQYTWNDATNCSLADMAFYRGYLSFSLENRIGYESKAAYFFQYTLEGVRYHHMEIC